MMKHWIDLFAVAPFAVNPSAVDLSAGDRPSPGRFHVSHVSPVAGRLGVAIASSLAALVGFVPIAQAQERQPSAPFSVQVELSPVSPEHSNLPERPALEPAAAMPAPADPPSPNTIGQIDTQRPELPFSDVPPDHWAYEALLYLSTGGRSPRSVP